MPRAPGSGCRREGLAERARRDRVPYTTWREPGALRVTEGNVTDYDVIREDLRELAERYQIREIAFDRWNATQLVTQLQADGATMLAMGQGFASLAAPTRELERLLLEGALQHGGASRAPLDGGQRRGRAGRGGQPEAREAEEPGADRRGRGARDGARAGDGGARGEGMERYADHGLVMV